MILIILSFIVIPLLSPVCIGIVRQLKANLQNRQGASIFQPYRDLWKLFHKDEVISTDASWVFLITPYLVFAISIVVPLCIPFLAINNNLLGLSDFLVIIYSLTLSSFFLSLAGIDTGSAFGGFGSSREMTILALTEGGLFFSFVPLLLMTHTTNLAMALPILAAVNMSQLLPLIVSFIAFMIALLAENSRIPFDNPATHLELTMVHEAMILEYSGKRLALIEWAAYNKLLIFISMGVTLFFPWGAVATSDWLSVGTALVFFLAKVLLVLIGIAVLESSIAKLRFFRLPDLLFTSFMLGIVATMLVFI